MKCEAEGKILVELTSTGGVPRDGKDWEKREYIMETSERYHSKMRFSVCSFDGPVDVYKRQLYEFEKGLNLKSGTIFKSSLSPESATPKGTITPPLSLSDIELRKYCIEPVSYTHLTKKGESLGKCEDFLYFCRRIKTMLL